MLKKLVERITKPVEVTDREKLSEYCDARLLEPMDAIVSRQPVRVGGEVRSVRIVPRAGAPALEVTITDGRGAVVAVFLGRRKVAGMSPGRRVALAGMAAKSGNRFVLVNPAYELLS